LILTVLLKEPLKFIFGRTWPSTFRDNNPSLIEDGVYGFFPFNSGIAFDAFPSGHTAAIAAAATLVWLTYPRWRYPAAVLVGLSAAGVIGLYYHFVSDVVAGLYFGVATGAGVARLLPQPHWAPGGGDGSEAG
jgi:membrane-associated phospholipid phosphatase